MTLISLILDSPSSRLTLHRIYRPMCKISWWKILLKNLHNHRNQLIEVYTWNSLCGISINLSQNIALSIIWHKIVYFRSIRSSSSITMNIRSDLAQLYSRYFRFKRKVKLDIFTKISAIKIILESPWNISHSHNFCKLWKYLESVSLKTTICQKCFQL